MGSVHRAGGVSPQLCSVAAPALPGPAGSPSCPAELGVKEPAASFHQHHSLPCKQPRALSAGAGDFYLLKVGKQSPNLL